MFLWQAIMRLLKVIIVHTHFRYTIHNTDTEPCFKNCLFVIMFIMCIHVLVAVSCDQRNLHDSDIVMYLHSVVFCDVACYTRSVGFKGFYFMWKPRNAQQSYPNSMAKIHLFRLCIMQTSNISWHINGLQMKNNVLLINEAFVIPSDSSF